MVSHGHIPSICYWVYQVTVLTITDALLCAKHQEGAGRTDFETKQNWALFLAPPSAVFIIVQPLCACLLFGKIKEVIPVSQVRITHDIYKALDIITSNRSRCSVALFHLFISQCFSPKHRARCSSVAVNMCLFSRTYHLVGEKKHTYK